jgi:hypothetical protein
MCGSANDRSIPQSLFQFCGGGMVKLTKRLAHGNRKVRLSLRGIAAELAAQGYITATGKPFSADQVSRLLAATMAHR